MWQKKSEIYKTGEFFEKVHGSPHQLYILITKDDLGKGAEWHLSVSHPARYPTWDEIKMVRYKYLPDDINFCMHFPPSSQFVNLHNNCFHLWEHHD